MPLLGKLRQAPSCVFVQLTQSMCRYLAVREAANKPQLLAAGAFECGDQAKLAAQLAEELASKNVKVSQAILLLPRGDLEINSLRLPPATEDELPEMVANMVIQEVDDVSEGSVHDFVISGESLDGLDVLSFTVSQETIDLWQAQFREHSMKLRAVTFGGIGAVSLLNQVSSHPARTSVVVTTTDQDTDLAVVELGRPVLFRTIPRATGGEQFVIEQLAEEIQRTLTLVGHPDDEETRVYLIGTVGEQQGAAQSLSDRLRLSVSLVNPFDQLGGRAHVDKPSRFANLIGTSCAHQRAALEVDFLNPRRPAPQQSTMSKYGFWCAIAACLVALAGYLWWEKQADQKAELADRQAELQRLIRPVKKAQKKQAIVKALDAWRANEISWLDEIHSLTKKLPTPDKATVGSLTMSALAQRGQIDMALVVSDPSVKIEFEQAIRDGRHAIQSKRLMDASNPDTPAWRFRTTIAIAPDPAAIKQGNSGTQTPETSEGEYEQEKLAEENPSEVIPASYTTEASDG